MRVATISAGAAGMYCGTCMHDNTLAKGLIARGLDVALLPTYTPPRTDETSVASDRVFFGALNVYLQQKSAVFRHTPWLVDKLLDRPRLLNWVSKLGSASTQGQDLGELTLSMLEGEDGHQAKELEKLVQWLEEDYRPDLVHLSLSLFLGFARQIKARLGVPVVCSLQGEDLFLDDLPDGIRPRVLEVLRDRARHVDAFTAPCPWYADRMAGALGIPREKIQINRLGIATSDFASAADGRRTDLDAPVLGFFARICPEKGLHLLVDAFRRLADEHPGVRLRIAGYQGERDRAFAEEQRRRLEASGHASRVDWVGEVDRDGKVEFFRSVDLALLPTVYQEPKGLSALEAMASGLPVVLPRHGTFPGLVERTGGGVLTEPGSADAIVRAVQELLGDPDRLRAVGLAAREGVSAQHDVEHMVDDTLTTYRSVAGDSPVVADPLAGAV